MTKHIERFEVRNRFTNAVQFTAEIVCEPDAAMSVKMGLAVKWGIKNGADLRWADLSGANLSGADLRWADLRWADLSGANLSGANLRWADLREATLRGANLRGANLRWADLSGANLRGADLSGANLRGANLRWADLSGANLRGADLSGANLRGANLRGADLRWADLRGANLRGASIDAFAIATPEEAAPRIRAVAQAALATPDALDMGSWHTCDTTHCIAGWAVRLAGDEGNALEEKFGTATAGLALLGTEAASHFYDTQEKGRAWLQSKLETTHD